LAAAAVVDKAPIRAGRRRALNALFWTNVNPYGRFQPDMDTRLDLDLAA
jgi:hypothetical protein